MQLVFVCAMWLTGFDVKNLSTLYLDKPMKGHMLMQAIARANRVYPGKTAGMIVDYVNVFKYMKKALSDYGAGDDETEFPAKEIKFAEYKAIEINDLKEYIEQALEQMINRNCTRTKFSERFKRIIDSCNAGGTENEDYY